MPLTPTTTPPPQPTTGPGHRGTPHQPPLTCVLATIRRGGAWHLGHHVTYRAYAAKMTIDLRAAVFTDRHLSIRLDTLAADVHLILPADVHLADATTRTLVAYRPCPPAPKTEPPQVRIDLAGRARLTRLTLTRARRPHTDQPT